MTDSTHHRELLGAGARNTVDTSRTCVNCGYQLRGLDRGGACPECGVPVMRSLQGDALRFAQFEYLARLDRSMRRIMWPVYWIVIGLVGFILIEMCEPSLGEPEADRVRRAFGLFFEFVLVTTLIAWAIGWTAITGPEPGRAPGHWLGVYLIRFGAALVIAGTSALLVAESGGLEATAQGLGATGVVLGLLLFYFPSVRCLNALAGRAPGFQQPNRLVSLIVWVGPFLIVQSVIHDVYFVYIAYVGLGPRTQFLIVVWGLSYFLLLSRTRRAVCSEYDYAVSETSATIQKGR